MSIKNYFLNLFSQVSSDNPERRNFFYKMLAGGGLALGLTQSTQAHKVEIEGEKEERFPGDPPEHFMLYSFNHAEKQYHQHVIGSVGAMIAKYEDNIDIVVVCFAQGIHVLLKKPIRPVESEITERIKSLAGQGVKFHACGRTLSSLKLGKEDVLPFVDLVEVGAADIMELQEQNYAYMVW
ncbi:MAG: DsrE family protein [Pseudomonadota bacterium]